MAFKEIVLFSSFVALAVLGCGEALTANSPNLSKQFSDVKGTIAELLDAVLDVAAASQRIKDATEDYEYGRTDYSHVIEAQQSLYGAKNKLFNALMKYLYEAQQLESSGMYPYGTSSVFPPHQPLYQIPQYATTDFQSESLDFN